jgi:hypothetical protein
MSRLQGFQKILLTSYCWSNFHIPNVTLHMCLTSGCSGRSRAGEPFMLSF